MGSLDDLDRVLAALWKLARIRPDEVILSTRETEAYERWIKAQRDGTQELVALAQEASRG